MAYNKKYYYKRIIKIQEITTDNLKNGATLKWIYERKIENTFHISYTTFSNYLGIPAKRLLNELETK